MILDDDFRMRKFYSAYFLSFYDEDHQSDTADAIAI